MTASPDDAAGSAVPPRRGEGPAAPSFPGTPGRRRPEEAPMPPEHDETIRMSGAAPGGRPSPTGQRPAVDRGAAEQPAAAPRATHAAPDREPDDTRPVGREWLHGAEPE